MTHGVSSREVALRVVRDVFGPDERGAQASFDRQTRLSGLDARDRAFAAQLAYGSIKMRRTLDWYLEPYIGERKGTLPPVITEILRLGAYQLRFMTGVDVHAAVYETVNLARRHGHKGTVGLVNAVLRRLIADAPAEPASDAFPTVDDYLGVRYSVPTWIAAQWRARFNGSSAAILDGINHAPQRSIRVNALRATRDEVAADLAGRGVVTAPSPFVDEVLIVREGNVGDDERGRWTLQGESAAIPVSLLAPQPGETILELCSGRGNKTVQIAARMENRGRVYSVEIEDRVRRVAAEANARAGVEIATPIAGDAREPVDGVVADGVLVDAPCTGLGILGRHPEARWRKRPEDAARLATLQRELLDAAATAVRAGGRIVYSVCTTDRREAEAVAASFLADHTDFHAAPVPEGLAPFAVGEAVVVAPGEEGRDGFFVVRFERGP